MPSLQVLVAGMPRTGTESMKKALEILYPGQGRVYHMSEVLNKPEHLKIWSDLAFERQSVSAIDWKSLLKGYVATTDMLCALYSKEIADAFPEAKVILTLRDEQEWFDSYYRLLVASYRFRFLRFLPPLNRFWDYGGKLHQIIFGDHAFDESGVPNREVIIAAYERHNAQIREMIAPERLLEFNVQQGWIPLCEFLGVDPCPKISFPHRNAGKAGPTKIIAKALAWTSLRPVLVTAGPNHNFKRIHNISNPGFAVFFLHVVERSNRFSFGVVE